EGPSPGESKRWPAALLLSLCDDHPRSVTLMRSKSALQSAAVLEVRPSTESGHILGRDIHQIVPVDTSPCRAGLCTPRLRRSWDGGRTPSTGALRRPRCSAE